VAAPGIGHAAEVLGLQGHRPGDAAQGQFSGQRAAAALPAGRASGERGGGMAVDVEQIGGAEVLVSFPVPGLHRGHVNGDLDRAVAGRVGYLDRP
jgi:hypothetical protein